MKVAYVRHNSEKIKLKDARELRDHQCIFINFSGYTKTPKSTKPNDYEGAGKWALKRFNEYVNEDTIIVAQYNSIDDRYVYVGVVIKGDKIKHKKLKSVDNVTIYAKTLLLHNAKEISISHNKLFHKSNFPKQRATAHWLDPKVSRKVHMLMSVK